MHVLFAKAIDCLALGRDWTRVAQHALEKVNMVLLIGRNAIVNFGAGNGDGELFGELPNLLSVKLDWTLVTLCHQRRNRSFANDLLHVLARHVLIP